MSALSCTALRSSQALWCSAKKKATNSTSLSRSGLYCLPLLQWNIVQAGSPIPGLVCAPCVCVRSLISPLPRVFIDIFLRCSHLGPPCVNINLPLKPGPLIPLTSLWCVGRTDPQFASFPPTPTILLWCSTHPILNINTAVETVHSNMFPFVMLCRM